MKIKEIKVNFVITEVYQAKKQKSLYIKERNGLLV